MNYTEVEAKVREATNDEAWGPTGRQMQEISQHTFTYEYYPEVMNMLWKRMIQDNQYNWRRTYKSLQLLNYLVTNGSERVVTSAREHIYDLRRLENYTYIDELGKDQGINVRQRAKLLIELIQDDDRIRQERKKAKQFKDKFVGVSNHSSYSDRDRDSWSDSSPRRTDRPYDDAFKDEIEQQPKRYDDAQDYDDQGKPSSQPKAKAASLAPNNNGNNQQPAKQRTNRTIKKIDLGAAALYAQEHASSKSAESNSTGPDLFSDAPTTDSQTKTADLLGDLFSDLTVTSTQTESAKTDEFADFSQFVGPTTNEPTLSGNKQAPNTGNDDFADFQSAFDSSEALNVSNMVQTVPSSNVVDLLSATSSNKPSDSASFAAMNPFLVAPTTEPPKSLFNTMSLLTPVTANNNNHLNTTAQQTDIKSEDSSCSSSSQKIG
ncbi:clathrin interactor 1-like protein [Euroglyphus maynei]|uniref:Clathrin interactor 1-like protein n=1 Tax=Euroglyphus maynei TaxID=6958 RepID=A0A1Y3B3C5_EURMA|nr:clathrin interactor 1-like protein [Euroglyphus maynei]